MNSSRAAYLPPVFWQASTPLKEARALARKTKSVEARIVDTFQSGRGLLIPRAF